MQTSPSPREDRLWARPLLYFWFSIRKDYGRLPLHFHGKARRVHSPLWISISLLVLVGIAIALFSQAVLNANDTAGAPRSDWTSIKLLGVGEAFGFLVTISGILIARRQYTLAKRPNVVFNVRRGQQINPTEDAAATRTSIFITVYGFTRVVKVLYSVGNLIGETNGQKGFLLQYQGALEQLKSEPQLAKTAELFRFLDGVMLMNDKDYPLFAIDDRLTLQAYVCFRFVVEGEFGDVFYRDFVYECSSRIVPPTTSN